MSIVKILLVAVSFVGATTASAVEFCDEPSQKNALFCADFSDGQALRDWSASLGMNLWAINGNRRFESRLSPVNPQGLQTWIASSLAKPKLPGSFRYKALVRNGAEGNESYLVFNADSEFGGYADDRGVPNRTGSARLFGIGNCKANGSSSIELYSLRSKNSVNLRKNPFYGADHTSEVIKPNIVNCGQGNFNTLRVEVRVVDDTTSQANYYVNNEPVYKQNSKIYR